MNALHEIPFTKFLMPDGRQKEEAIAVPLDEYEAYHKAEILGFRMTVELLSDWATVSMCIEEPELGDFDCILCPNGPEVLKALRKMLLRFDETKAKEWIEENK